MKNGNDELIGSRADSQEVIMNKLPAASQIRALAQSVLDKRSESEKQRFTVRSGIKGGAEFSAS